MRFDLLTTPEVAALTRLRKNYLERLRCTGGGPPFVKLNARRVAYCQQDVLDWLNARRWATTCTPAQPVAPHPHSPTLDKATPLTPERQPEQPNAPKAILARHALMRIDEVLS